MYGSPPFHICSIADSLQAKKLSFSLYCFLLHLLSTNDDYTHQASAISSMLATILLFSQLPIYPDATTVLYLRPLQPQLSCQATYHQRSVNDPFHCLTSKASLEETEHILSSIESDRECLPGKRGSVKTDVPRQLHHLTFTLLSNLRSRSLQFFSISLLKCCSSCL